MSASCKAGNLQPGGRLPELITAERKKKGSQFITVQNLSPQLEKKEPKNKSLFKHYERLMEAIFLETENKMTQLSLDGPHPSLASQNDIVILDETKKRVEDLTRENVKLRRALEFAVVS